MNSSHDEFKEEKTKARAKEIAENQAEIKKLRELIKFHKRTGLAQHIAIMLLLLCSGFRLWFSFDDL